MSALRTKKTKSKNKKTGNLWAVIMAGGTGTRFWPESRAKLPKQFLSLVSHKTLIGETVDRLSGVVPKSRIIVVTQKDKVALVKKLIKIPAKHIVGEPIGRNTAPCAALAAAIALKEDPHAVIALLPADHHIGQEKKFREFLRFASAVTCREKLPVTFGIKPSSPHTGYGYLEKGRKLKSSGKFQVFNLKCFHEKPSLVKAKRFLKAGKFLWNSGMFVWGAEELLSVTKKHLPKAHKLSAQIVKGNLQKNLNRYFKNMPSISIDYGLMEKLKGSILTIPVDLSWNDLGGWLSFQDFWPEDKDKNVSKGDVVFVESRRNIVKSDKRLVAVLGVSDFVIVDTKDALLVCPRKDAENVRAIVSSLKSKSKLKKYL